MKKLLIMLTVLIPIQLFAGTNCVSDTIKISIIDNEISIEADNLQELKELLNHDLNALLKNLNLNLSEVESKGNADINMEVIVQNDSIVEHIQISSNLNNQDGTRKKTKKIISISDEGIYIKNSATDSTLVEISDHGIFIETEVEITKMDALIEKLEEYTEDWLNTKTEEPDTTKRTFMMTEVHIGFNNYLNEDGKIISGEDYSLKSGFGSFAWAEYAKTRIFPNGPLFLKYGLTLTSNNYKYANNYILRETDEGSILIENPNEIQKSKLSTLFIDAPLMLQLDFSSDKEDENGFNIAVGPFVGYMLKAKTKIIYLDENNNTNKEKQKGEYNINKVRYGLQAQFGVMGFNFYGKYHLSSLFENNKGPENLNVIDFGIIFDL
jgi:hypothetical protein